MNGPEAKRMVVIGTVGTGLVTVVGSLAGEDHRLPSASVAVGAFAAGIMLAGLAEVWPAGAGGLAALMLLTALTVYGEPAWNGLSGLFQPS